MRVLQVIPSVAPERGGTTESLIQISRALAARGVEVSVLSTRSDLDLAGEREVRRRLGDVRLELTASVGSSRLEFSPGWVAALARELGRAELAHVHSVFTFPAASAPPICRALGVPYVLSPCGMLDAACLAERSPRLKRLALAAWVKRNLAGAAAVHATSELEERELRALQPRAKVVRVELGATPQPATSIRPRARVVGSLGRLHPIKRLEPLLDALALLPPEIELHLAGAGDPAYVASLRRRADRLGLARRVRFLGHLDEPARRTFFHTCDVMVFPSRHESFGLAIAESLAAGLPLVLSPDLPWSALLSRSRAALVTPISPESLARTLAPLLPDAPERLRLSTTARSLSTLHTWDTTAAHLLALYEGSLSG